MPDSVMDRLNLRMTEIYGHRWTSAYTRDALDTWAKGLAGLTVEQIKRGVEACITGAMAWPPTLPEFRALCLTVVGAPSADEAWGEALQVARRWKGAHQCSHPAIFHALSQVADFTMIDEEVLHQRFVRNYEQTLRLLAAGEQLAPIPQPLPRPEDVRTNYSRDVDAKARERARDEAFARLDALMGRSASA